MDDASRMRLSESLACLEDEVAGLVDGQRPALREELGEVGPAQMLHHDERGAVRQRADLEDAHDVLALDRRRRSSFPEEAGDCPVPRRLVRREELDRDRSAERDVDGAHHDAHTAGANDGVDPVFPAHHLAGARKVRSPAVADRRIHGFSLTTDCLARNSGFTYRTRA